MGISGVYCITIGENFYIGSTTNFKKREREHFWSLKKNTHSNRYLQSAYNKYDYYDIELIDECEIADLKKTEQTYLDQWFDDDRCMNLLASAHVTWGHTFGEDVRKKMSEAAKRRDPSTRNTAPKSEECKRKIGEANGKLGWDGATEVRRLHAEGVSQAEIARRFKMDQSTISDVVTGKSWKVGQ